MMTESKFWVGVVEDRNDPLKLGRCRVRVFGTHTETLQELPTNKLSWAHPILPLNNPNPYAPKEGDIVVGFFMDGEESQFPMMMGVVSGIPTGKANTTYGFNDLRTAEQLKNAPSKPAQFKEGQTPYPRAIDEPTTPRLARKENIANSQFQIKLDNLIKGSPEVVTPPKTIYPYNNVYESESGHLLEFDDSPKGERVQLFHRSGSYIEYLPDGSVTEKAQGSKTDTTKKKSTIYVGEDLTVIVKGSVTYQVDKDFTVSCDNFNVSAKGKGGISSVGAMSMSSSKGKLSLSSKTMTTVSAMGYVSVSAQGYASISALGPTKMTSKVVCDVGAPIVNIGILGAASPENAKTAVGEAAKSSATAAASAAAKGMTASLGSLGTIVSVNPSTWAVNFTSFSDYVSIGNLNTIGDSLGGILSNVEGAFSSIASSIESSIGGFLGDLSGTFSDLTSSLGNLDFSNFSSLGDGISSLTDSFGSLSDLGSTFSGLAESLSSNLTDTLGSILDSDAFSSLTSAFDGLGPDLLNSLPGASSLLENKGLFDAAKTAFDVGKDLLAGGNPLAALSNLGGAADIVGGEGFLSNLSSTFDTVTSALRNTSIATTFNDIQGLLNEGGSVISRISDSITPTFNSFVDSAKSAFSGNFENVAGVSDVLDRVAEQMKFNPDIKNGVSKLIADGFSLNSTPETIQENISSYLQDSFSTSVTSEMTSSPITFLNVVERSGTA